jgi:hypothetical protein
MRQEERGVALLVALIVAILLSLLGLSLTFSSMSESAVSSEFENHEKALLIADGGFNAAKQILRGKSVDEILQAETAAPNYLMESDGSVAAWAARNPISPLDARSIDFDNPPVGGSHSVFGLLTPPDGVPLATGRYFAKLTDNNDEPPGVVNDPRTDTDGIVFLRVVGIHRGNPGEQSAYGSNRRNSVAIIEAQLRRDLSFSMNSPLSLVADQVSAAFNGNSFLIDGHDHSGMTIDELRDSHKKAAGALAQDQAAGLEAHPGISCLYDDQPGDAENALADVQGALQAKQKDQVIGEGGANSLFDYTQEVRDSDNPDARNVLDPVFLETVAARLAVWADTRYKDDTHLSGGATFGTTEAPKITYADKGLTITGSATGAGLLVIRGKFDCGGSFDFEGLVLVLGEGNVRMHGANKGILGGMLVANVQDGELGEAAIDIDGNSQFYFAGDSISLALDLIGMRTLSWREITPEIEPTD